MRDWKLAAAALLLLATAAFHLSGTGMAAGWVDGPRARMVALLWITPAAIWIIAGLCWGYLYLARREPGWPLLVTTAAIPLVTGVPLLVLSRGLHPGAYMLLGSSLLALASGRRKKS